MRNLIELFHKYNYVFLFVLLQAVSIFLLFSFNDYQGSVALTSANSAVATVDRLYGDMEAYSKLKGTNASLTDSITRLQMENSVLRRELAVAKRDTAATEREVLNTLNKYRLIPALVVSNSNSDDLNNYIIIDKGERDGIKEYYGVVSGGGVIGIVSLVGERYSLVIPVVNRKSSISCRIRGKDYFGYLGWDGGKKLYGYVDDIPRYADVKVGDCIETNGYSEIFPPGIFIGRVTRIDDAPDGQSYRLIVNLGIDFANLRNVNVIASSFRAEVDTLRNHAAIIDGSAEEKKP